MTGRHAQASEAIGEAWAHWLSQHPVTLDNIISDAVRSAASDWLASHTDELLDHIAAEAAKRIPPGRADNSAPKEKRHDSH